MCIEKDTWSSMYTKIMKNELKAYVEMNSSRNIEWHAYIWMHRIIKKLLKDEICGMELSSRKQSQISITVMWNLTPIRLACAEAQN